MAWLLVGLLFAFLLGLLGSPLAERQARSMLPPTFREEGVLAAEPEVDQLLARLEALESAVADNSAATVGPSDPVPAVPSGQQAAATPDSPTAAQVDQLAGEVARLAVLLDGSEARVRDLFLLSVARRMLEAGRPLTPVLEAIRLQFRSVDAAAVEALEAWSVAPQTRATLRAQLELLQPAPAPQGSFWERLGARLSGLVRVRGESEVPAAKDAETQLAEARTHLRAGELELAISSLGRGGDTAESRQWIADARLLLAAEDALARLDADALARAIAAVRPVAGDRAATADPVAP